MDVASINTNSFYKSKKNKQNILKLSLEIRVDTPANYYSQI
jgi:hypothetical protein